MGLTYAVFGFALFLFVATGISKGLGLPFLYQATKEVRKRGGKVLRAELRIFYRGPFTLTRKSATAKVIYIDRQGAVQQLWGRSGFLWAKDDFVWNFSDGDNDVSIPPWSVRGVLQRVWAYLK